MSRPPLWVDWSSALSDLARLIAFEPAAVDHFMDAFEDMAATGFNLGRGTEDAPGDFRYVVGNIQAIYDEDRPYLTVIIVEDVRQLGSHS